MPREIVTVQLGQCGNQSMVFMKGWNALIDTIFKWVLSFGNVSVPNTELARTEFLRSGQQKGAIVKTSSFIKQMTNITFLVQFLSTLNLGYLVGVYPLLPH